MTATTATKTRKTATVKATPAKVARTRAKAVSRFVVKAEDVTVAAPVEEPSEKPVSDANAPTVAQPAADAPTEPEKAGKAGPYSREVLFSEAKVSKQYFAAFGVDGGTAIVKAAAPDVEVQANKKAESLIITGKKRDVDRAAKVLVATWVEGFAAFNIWRRTDESYKSLQHTGKEATVRYHREQDWLRNYAQQQDAS